MQPEVGGREETLDLNEHVHAQASKTHNLGECKFVDFCNKTKERYRCEFQKM